MNHPMNFYSKSFTDVAVACALFYQQNCDEDRKVVESGPHFRNIAKALNNFYHLLAKIEGETLSGWKADDLHPGWLLQNRFPIFIRVPVHLAALFPTNEYLDELFSISNKIRSSPKSIICISGSNSVKNILDIVDDIDFCEYLPIESEGFAKDLVERISKDTEVICCSLKVASQNFVPQPHKAKEIESALSKVTPDIEGCATFKVDYVVRMSDRRAFDASNVVIVCDPEFKSTGFKTTFAHQEVHISASDKVPIELDDVMELGRYSVWLLSQVKKYRDEGNAAKMLKRALSLTRTFWMKEYTTEISVFLSRTTFLIERELKTISDLRGKLDSYKSLDEWREIQLDLDYYEEVARLEKKKLEVVQNRHFPAGPEDFALALGQKIIDDCIARSKGALQI